MAKLLFKYNVEARNREGNDNTWSILNTDTEEVITVDHIELKVPISTEEKELGLGFGMTCEGEIEFKEHPTIGRYAVIREVK